MAVVSWLSNDNEVTKKKIRDDNIAPIELNALSASRTYTVGKPFVLDSDGKLYKATQQIDQGSAIITSGENANCEEVSNGAEGIFGTKQDIFNLNSAVGNLASRVGMAEGNITTLNEIKANTSDLGTASTKNSTSVVTDSSDLVESGAVEQTLRDAEVIEGKNLLNPTVASSGIVTRNADNTFTVNGTLSSATLYELGRDCLPTLSIGDYMLSGCPKSGVPDGTTLSIRKSNTSSGTYHDYGNGVVWNVTDAESASAFCYIYLPAGTYNNAVFKPMFEKGTVATAYEPYYTPLKDVVPTKANISDLGTASSKNSTSVVTDSSDLVESGAVKDIVGWGNKNLLENKAITTTIGGITYTVEGDKSVSISGTRTDSSYIVFTNKSNLLTEYSNTVIPSGTPIIASLDNNAFSIMGGRYTDGSWFSIPLNTAFIPEKNIGMLYSEITASMSASGTKLYPMVRKADVTDTAYEPYHASVEESKCDNSTIAPVENGSTASQAYAVGEHFIRDGAFCTVTQAISSGGDLLQGTNYTSGDVARLIPKIANVYVALNEVTWNLSVGGVYYTQIPNTGGHEILSASIGDWSVRDDNFIPIPYIRPKNNGIGLVSKTNNFSSTNFLNIVYTYR